MKKIASVMAMVLAAGAFVGCDSKEAEKAKATVADTAKPAGDAVKKAADTVKDTATKAADTVKDTAVKTADAAKTAVKDAAAKGTEAVKAAIPADAKKAFDSYVSELGNTNGVLAKITSLDTAKSALGDLAKSVTSFNAASGLVDKLPADVKSALMSGEGKGALDTAVTAFKGHLDRLNKDMGIKTLLGDTLKQFKLVG